MRGALKVCAVKAPGFGDRRKDMVRDIAIMTGANVVSEDTATTLESIQPGDFGSAKKVVISKKNTSSSVAPATRPLWTHAATKSTRWS